MQRLRDLTEGAKELVSPLVSPMETMRLWGNDQPTPPRGARPSGRYVSGSSGYERRGEEGLEAVWIERPSTDKEVFVASDRYSAEPRRLQRASVQPDPRGSSDFWDDEETLVAGSSPGMRRVDVMTPGLERRSTIERREVRSPVVERREVRSPVVERREVRSPVMVERREVRPQVLERRSTGRESRNPFRSTASTQPVIKSITPTPNDVVILIMGITGAGKTTFIQNFSSDNLGVGHGLESCTNKIEVVPCQEIDGRRLFLIDSPGFDDTYRSDTEVLCEVANWLNEAYLGRIKLSGIIYLHRIIDPRLGGSGMKNLRMFRKLCGDGGLKSVALVTTMWNLCSNTDAVRREGDLVKQDGMWKSLIAQGAQVFRQDDSLEAAARIVSYLIENHRPVTLKIQQEMAVQGLKLSETAAGKEVQDNLERLTQKHRQEMKDIRNEMSEAIREKDKQRQEELREYRQQVEQQMVEARKQAQQLEASREKLKRDMKEEHERDMAELRQRISEQQQEVASQERNLRAELERAKNSPEILELKAEIQKQREELLKWQQKAQRKEDTYKFSCSRCGLKTNSYDQFINTPCIC